MQNHDQQALSRQQRRELARQQAKAPTPIQAAKATRRPAKPVKVKRDLDGVPSHFAKLDLGNYKICVRKLQEAQEWAHVAGKALDAVTAEIKAKYQFDNDHDNVDLETGEIERDVR